MSNAESKQKGRDKLEAEKRKRLEILPSPKSKNHQKIKDFCKKVDEEN